MLCQQTQNEISISPNFWRANMAAAQGFATSQGAVYKHIKETVDQGQVPSQDLKVLLQTMLMKEMCNPEHGERKLQDITRKVVSAENLVDWQTLVDELGHHGDCTGMWKVQ